MLKAFGADFGVVPSVGNSGAPKPIDHLVANIEDASAFGCLQPFVRTRTVHVATQFLDVEAKHARRMSAVDHGDNTFRSREITDFLDGLDYACVRRDMAGKNHLGARGD